MRRALGAIFLLCLVPIQLCAAAPLEGCLTESEIASAAGKLAQEDWNTVSLTKLRTIWPTELSGLNCEADVCHSVWSMDRIIFGKCECCETFAFSIGRSTGTRTEQLDEVVFNYSMPERDQLLSAAKKILGNTGITDAELATIGRTNDRHFDWIKTSHNRRELSSLELRFSQRGQLWHLFINWGRNDLDSAGHSQ